MKLCTPRLLVLAATALAFNACSSEPSDWRPEDKVSLDMVPPGTRASEMFRTDSADMPSQAKGAAISRPINSSVPLEQRPMPNAAQARTADAVNLKSEEKMNDASPADGDSRSRPAGGKK